MVKPLSGDKKLIERRAARGVLGGGRRKRQPLDLAIESFDACQEYMQPADRIVVTDMNAPQRFSGVGQ